MVSRPSHTNSVLGMEKLRPREIVLSRWGVSAGVGTGFQSVLTPDAALCLLLSSTLLLKLQLQTPLNYLRIINTFVE